jgi:antitoxin MazE
MKAARWGNSLAIRLRRAVLRALDLKSDDEIEISVAGPRAFEIAKAPDRRELAEQLRKYQGRLPDGLRFDRPEANER